MSVASTSSLRALLLLLLSVLLYNDTSDAFVVTSRGASQIRRAARATVLQCSDNSAWNGQVVSNVDKSSGRIRGCTLENTGLTEWIVTIDGEEADLGKFSEAIYRKIAADAKQQRFQGFRPGTIPPHLEPTYRAFAMDECAREATLEAMQQNNIRPFEEARLEMEIETVSIPPPVKKKSKKKKKRGSDVAAKVVDEQEVVEPEWLTFENMKGAIDAGWKPGQSFSFIAKKVKGQKLKDEDVSKAKPLGVGGIDMNQIAADSVGKSVDE